MKSNSAEVLSHSTYYWLRWVTAILSIGMFYWLGRFTQGQAPAQTFHALLAAVLVLAVLLALYHRPRSFRIEVDDKEIRLLKLPSGSVKRVFDRDDVRYVTVRSTGHLFGLSVLRIIVRTKSRGSIFFGPIYIDGVDGVMSSDVAHLLPRISREGLLTKDSKSS